MFYFYLKFLIDKMIRSFMTPNKNRTKSYVFEYINHKNIKLISNKSIVFVMISYWK